MTSMAVISPWLVKVARSSLSASWCRATRPPRSRCWRLRMTARRRGPLPSWRRSLAMATTPVHWWRSAPSDGDIALARSLGAVGERRLLQMRRSLPTGLPVDVATRAFRVGADEAAWVTVNNRAFAAHPEQGRWTIDDVRAREAEPWFDADGFRLHERDGRLAAFCWTKLHHDHQPVLGEIYVIGVDPDFQGLGLGRALTLAGLASIAGPWRRPRDAVRRRGQHRRGRSVSGPRVRRPPCRCRLHLHADAHGRPMPTERRRDRFAHPLRRHPSRSGHAARRRAALPGRPGLARAVRAVADARRADQRPQGAARSADVGAAARPRPDHAVRERRRRDREVPVGHRRWGSGRDRADALSRSGHRVRVQPGRVRHGVRVLRHRPSRIPATSDDR